MAVFNHHPELNSLPYYHKDLQCIDDVKKLMINYLGKDGSFLIRNSFSKPGCLTVSVMHNNGIKHFNLGEENGEYFVQELRFGTISDLVTYYGRNDVPNQECVKHVRLTYPILSNQLPSLPSVASTMSLPRSVASSRSSSATDSPLIMRDPSATLPRRLDSDNGTRNHVRTQSVPDLQLPKPVQPQRGTSIDQTSPKQKSIFRLFRRKKSESTDKDSVFVCPSVPTNGLDSLTTDGIANRPPAPIPPDAIRSSQATSDAYPYEVVRDTTVNRVDELIQNLKSNEYQSDNIDKCECGLSFEESELPRGWSMHISHDRLTNGRLFFMGPNKETAWNLPMVVSLELSPDQQERIRELLERSDLPQPHAGADSGESHMPGSLPSSPINYSSMATVASGIATQISQLSVTDDVAGGASSVGNGSVPTSEKHATQHNEHTGSTESPGLRM